MSKKPAPKAGKAKAPAKKAAVVKALPQKAAKLAPSAKSLPAAAQGKKLPLKTAAKAPLKMAAKASAATSAAKPVPARTMAVAKAEPPKKSEGMKKKMAARVKVSDIVLPPNYRPSEDEPFMSEMHRAYFRKRLIEWKDDILRQTRETLAILHEDSTQHADLADRATSETDRATELRTRDRQRKLIAKIDAALGRIEDGSYGYCEDTGEPIGLKRLDARPIATLSVEAQERHERRERVYREE